MLLRTSAPVEKPKGVVQWVPVVGAVPMEVRTFLYSVHYEYNAMLALYTVGAVGFVVLCMWRR